MAGHSNTDSTATGHSDNTIKIYNSPNLSNAILYGKYGNVNGVIGGNTLDIYTKDITAKNIVGFYGLNFYLPEDTVNGDTILTLTETNTDLSSAVISAGVQGNANLNVGDTITLLWFNY